MFARIHAQKNAISNTLRNLQKLWFYKVLIIFASPADLTSAELERGMPESWRLGWEKLPYGVPPRQNSSLSPGLVRVISTVPDASSITEWAERHADNLQGGTPLLIFFTLLLRSR